MTLNIKDVPQGGGGGWLKPEEHADDVAILVEPKRFDRDRPSDFGPKDSVVCDITFFKTMAELTAGTPSVAAKGMRVEYTVLTRDLMDEVGLGNATIVTLAQSKAKPGRKPAWVWRATSQDVKSLVIAFAKKREDELQAALAAAPDFE